MPSLYRYMNNIGKLSFIYMDPSLYRYMLFLLMIWCCISLNTVLTDSSSSSTQPLLCHEDESSALLQFKRNFVIKKFASSDSFAYPKVASWRKLVGGNTSSSSSSSCCSWDGVECDEKTDRVIGLDLSSSFLYGSIDSNSTLFCLVHLQRLNLADNHFNFSPIPPGIGRLSRLTSLTLSSSFFSGQIPPELSSLSKLAFLNLSFNVDANFQSLLRLERPSLRDLLVQNLSNLRVLDLSDVNISATVPAALSNMTSLATLSLQSCFLYGEFPMGIFRLPSLKILGMTGNADLAGHLPEFDHQGSSPLQSLLLGGTSFSGMIPNSIGNLESLNTLELKKCFFYGTLPPSLGNLTQLSALLLTANELVGQIPSSLLNLTGLTSLDLSRNQLQGMFPISSISQLKHLEVLNLAFNNMRGEVELDSLLELRNLTRLHMSYNKLTVVLLTNNNYSTNATINNKFKQLGFSSCNLRKFPDFLRFQDELVLLFLAHNNFHEQIIPTWLWNISRETMTVIDLGYNFLTSSEHHHHHLPDVIPWRSVRGFDFSYNRLQGSLPLPPPSITVYLVAGNLLTGEIPPSFCQSSSLSMLDMSDNYLNGTIPQCLVSSSSSDSLLLLNLSSNNLRGTIPPTVMLGIKMIDFSRNQLHGEVPRSLANCTTLQILVLEHNQIEGTFPFWLGALPELEVLILRSNRFHGAIENPKTNNLKLFPKLCIVDLSQNGFSGKLPSEYFKSWNAMKVVKKENSTYLQMVGNMNSSGQGPKWVYQRNYTYSVTIDSKGTNRVYEKIQSAFVVIDFSNNKFSGEIPETLGSLSGLQLLNISNNDLAGVIPSSLANLTQLESLDLSRNLLSGEIPQQLTQLTFLSVLNVSHNRLTGPIPQGEQFPTFENSSYEGNSGLCGVPLSKLCGTAETPPPPPPPCCSSQGDDDDDDDDSEEFPSGIYSMVIIVGYGCGLIVGLLIGTTLTRRYHEWFVETLL